MNSKVIFCLFLLKTSILLLKTSFYIYVVRKRLNIDSTQAIFLFSKDNTLPTGSQEVVSVYDELKDDDGFLYLFYSAESTFGNI